VNDTRTMMLLNLILGTLVTSVGFWILWNGAPEFVVAGWVLAIGGFLWWKAKSVTEVWAWTTLALGVESFAWPLQRMVQLKTVTETPSHDEMGAMLSDIVLGLFFSVFWMAFAYGLFKWAWKTPVDEAVSDTMATTTVRTDKRKKG